MTVAICGVLVVETVVLHLWLARAQVWIAVGLTVTSLATLAWIVGDAIALGRRVITVDGAELHLRVGWRVTATMPRKTVTVTVRPSWREREAAERNGCVNLTKPAEPNVLLTCAPAASLRLAGGLRYTVTEMMLCLDAPEEFARAVIAE